MYIVQFIYFTTYINCTLILSFDKLNVDMCVYLWYKYVTMYINGNHSTLTGFFQVGITALANLTARYATGSTPRRFFSLEKVLTIRIGLSDE